jgi:hypothetical protein
MDSICQNYEPDPTKNMYFNGCTSCKVKDYPTNPTELKDYQDRANLVSNILIVLTLLIVIYFVYIRFIGYEKSVFSRIRKYYGDSFSQLGFGLIAIILTSDIMSSLNSNILIPLINSIIPGEGTWDSPVCLPRGEFMLPGRFFKSLVNFIITLGLLFILTELFGRMFIGLEFIRSKFTKTDTGKGKFLQYSLFLFIGVVILYLVVGNYMELDTTDSSEEPIRVFNKPTIFQ